MFITLMYCKKDESWSRAGSNLEVETSLRIFTKLRLEIIV
jgi:hypothetical protein